MTPEEKAAKQRDELMAAFRFRMRQTDWRTWVAVQGLAAAVSREQQT